MVQIKENWASKNCWEKRCMKQGWEASEKRFDFRGGVAHGNDPEYREETDCLFAEQNVYILYLHFLFFVSLELNFRITKLWWLPSVGNIVGSTRSLIVVVPATSREKEGGEMVSDRDMATEEKICCLYTAWMWDKSWGLCHCPYHHHKNYNTHYHESREQVLWFVW